MTEPHHPKSSEFQSCVALLLVVYLNHGNVYRVALLFSSEISCWVRYRAPQVRSLRKKGVHLYRSVRLLPSLSCLQLFFLLLRLVLTPTSIGLCFVFPFEYLHRLHYDSIIGLALVYPRDPYGPWTYESHAEGRTLSPTFYIFWTYEPHAQGRTLSSIPFYFSLRVFFCLYL